MADQGFECDFCSTNFKMVQNLRKHYRNIHNLSEEEAIQRTDGLKEPKQECPNCNKSVIRLGRHVCPKEQFSPPKGQRAAKKPNCGNVLPSTSGACALFEEEAIQRTDGTFEKKQAAISEIMVHIEKFLKSLQGESQIQSSIRESPIQVTCRYIRTFFSCIADEDEANKDLFRILRSTDPYHIYFALPNPEKFAKDHIRNKWDQQMFFDAFKQLCKFFLHDLKSKEKDFADPNEYKRRKDLINSLHDEANSHF